MIKDYNYIDKYLLEITEVLTISDTMANKAIKSYESVGKTISLNVENHHITISPQGSFNLGTVVKPISDEDEYDIDLVCSIDDGIYLSEKSIKKIIGDAIKENTRYSKMLDEEGKRCWTLQYDEFHMDILPCVPMNNNDFDTTIRITHKINEEKYESRYSNPKGYKEWFVQSMQTVYQNNLRAYANSKNINIEDVPNYVVLSPLQRSIILLKRMRDKIFEGEDNLPISIIITTLAALAYKGEDSIFFALKNIVNTMDEYIVQRNGKYIISNPALENENFAEKWNEETEKADMFYKFLKEAKNMIIKIESVDHIDELSEVLKYYFGKNITNKAYDNVAKNFYQNTLSGKNYINCDTGEMTDKNISSTKRILSHTFYGK